MKEENRKCWNCGNFSRYYTKSASRFEKTKQGVCSKCQKIVTNRDCCELWRNRNTVTCLRKLTATKALRKILEDLAAIRQIFEEEQEENTNDKKMPKLPKL